MAQTFRRLISFVIALLLISGCASTGTATGSNKTISDATQTKVEGAAISAGFGALLGAGIALATGNKDDALKYALVGAAAGGLLGYVAGNRVAQIKEQYATEEERLDAEIKLAAELNQELISQNEATKNQISSLEREIASILSSNTSRQKQIATLQVKKSQADGLIKQNNETVSNIRTELDALIGYKQSVEQTQDAQQINQMEQEITTLQTNIAMLDQSNRQMAQMAESLNIRK